MPVYVYQCKNCNHVFEQRQSFSDDALRICPQCGEETLRKRYNTVVFPYKGPGLSTTPKVKSLSVPQTSPNGGRANTGPPAPRRFKKCSPSGRRYTILLPQCGGRC